jgi:uncharacterized protein (TIGR02996 family)
MAKKSRVSKTKKVTRTLTPEDHDFIRRILANLDDDAPRLAYAEWLEQQGDRDRAEFIRVQIEAARLSPQDARREQQNARAAELLQAHDEEWRALLPPDAGGRVAGFERGFPTWARCGLEDFPFIAVSIWQVAPVTQLDMYDCQAATWDVDFKESWIRVESYEAVANVPQLVHVRSLSVCECAILGKHLKPLLASPHLTNLHELHLSINRLGDAGAMVVAELPRAASLTHLDLSENDVGNQGATTLAQSPHLCNLKKLLLRVNCIGEQGGRAIANSPSLANLEQLDLGGNELEAAEEELRQRFGDRLIL